jgi:hypothetical protein
MKKYIILSLKHGTETEPIFWRSNNAGYTSQPWAAGIYTEEQVNEDPQYYNNGLSTIAVPLEDSALKAIGFSCIYNEKKLLQFHKKSRKPQTTNSQP